MRKQKFLNSLYVFSDLGSFGHICWVEFPFHVLLSSSSSSLLWSRWIPPSFFMDETPPGTLWRTPEFDGGDCVLLFVLCGGGFLLDWSWLPNRKAFRKLINVNKGERIHNNSSGNDEFPDGVRALLPFTATIKVELGARPNSAKLFPRSSSVSSRLG